MTGVEQVDVSEQLVELSYKGCNIQLSHLEIKCAQLIAKRQTIIFIADCLNISRIDTDKLIKEIKNKFSVDSIDDLISSLNECFF